MRRLIPLLALVAFLAAGCGSEGTTKATPETVIGTVQTQTTEVKGDPAAGKEVFDAQGCGSCHAFEPAGSTGNVGPDLTEALKDKDAEFIRQSIVDPNAEIAEGFQPNIMPQTYGSQLSDKQLADLVAFLQSK